MTILDLLRAHWNIWGLDAPKFAWIAAIALLAIPGCLLLYLLREVRRQSSILRDAVSRIDRLRARTTHNLKGGGENGPGNVLNNGLSARGYASLADTLANTSTLAHAWNSYSAGIIVRASGTGEDQFWASESAGAAFTDSALWDRRVNRAFYNSLPGVVTSTGLLFTFLAILVALVDVRINAQTNQI